MIGITLSALFILSGLAHAGVLHVTAAGGSGACTAAKPCSVGTGVQAARRGDIVQFGPGDYQIQLNTKADGVTFRGAPGHTTRLRLPSSSSSKHIVGVKHDKTIIEGFTVDGEKKDNSGHGLIRIGTSDGVKILRNRIVDSGSSHISVGGSWKNSIITNVEIRGNFLCGAGFVGEYGESIYVGDFNGTGIVDRALIVANELCQFSDNAIDLKPPAQNVTIEYNFIHHQIQRHGTGNHGTIVAQGKNHVIRNNLLTALNGGSAVFNLTERSNIRVTGNVVSGVTGTDRIARIRGGGKGSATMIEKNAFCSVNTKKSNTSTGLLMRDNYGLDLPAVDCTPLSVNLLAAIEHRETEVPPIHPPDLPKLKLLKATLAEPHLGENVVRLYLGAEDDSDPQMDLRDMDDAVSVRFESAGGYPLAFRKEKPAKPDNPPGWTFYLTEPYPRADIRMVADAGWITGAPKLDVWVTYSATDAVQPEQYTLRPGDTAICLAGFSLTDDGQIAKCEG